MSARNKRSTGELYDAALMLRIHAQAWEPGARILGNVRADTIEAVMDDYIKLRLELGISNHEYILSKKDLN